MKKKLAGCGGVLVVVVFWQWWLWCFLVDGNLT